MIKKKKVKHDKTILLARSKLNTIEVFASKALNNSEMYFDKFLHVGNLLKGYNDIKEPIKHPNSNKLDNV